MPVDANVVWGACEKRPCLGSLLSDLEKENGREDGGWRKEEQEFKASLSLSQQKREEKEKVEGQCIYRVL